MLLEFKVSNYRSICEEQIISMVPATNQKEYPQNIITDNKYQALNALSIYGPNGGGKSNLLRSMSLMDKMISTSGRDSSTSILPYDPFLLKTSCREKPTSLEISFVIGEDRYRYGYDFIRTEIKNEWLFRKSVGREVQLFNRNLDTIDVSSGFNGSSKLIDASIEATRSNALFLSTCDTLNVEEAKRIMNWFGKFTMIDGLNAINERTRTEELWESEEYKEKIRSYITSLSLNVVNIEMNSREVEESDLGGNMSPTLRTELLKAFRGQKQYNVIAEHRVYDEEGKPTNETVRWRWNDKESSGAKQVLILSGPVIWALATGGVLIIDEIEAKLHPEMTLNTIDVFLNKESNPNKAQLLFATHDTNLLTYSNLRRDQICFAEKNEWESTILYSLSDFKYLEEKSGETKATKERPDTDKEKRYIEGRYGAIPAFANFKKFIRNKLWQEEENY